MAEAMFRADLDEAQSRLEVSDLIVHFDLVTEHHNTESLTKLALP